MTDWGRHLDLRGALVGTKMSLIAGLGAAIEAQNAANAADPNEVTLGGQTYSLKGVEAPSVPSERIRIRHTGPRNAQSIKLAEINITAVPGAQLQEMGLGAALAEWAVGVYATMGRGDDASVPGAGLDEEEALLLRCLTLVAACREAIRAPGTGIHQRYGHHGTRLTAPRIVALDFDQTDRVTQVTGETIWRLQGVAWDE